MDPVVAAALLVVNTVWLGLVLVRLPGIWLMALTTTVVAWWRSGMFSPWTLLAVWGLAAASEVLEFAAGAAGAKLSGGTRRAVAAAAVGGVIGGILGTVLVPVPVLGSLVGAVAGAALAASLAEFSHGRPTREAARSGAGAGAGTLTGVMLKLLFGALVWVLVTIAAFWP